MDQFPDRDRNTRVPSPLPPAGSCDCHLHVFADAQRYPPAAGRTYDPPAATFADLERLHRTLGIERAVIVQASIYGTDNRLMVDTIAGRKNYRGVAVIDDSTSDAELARMNEGGVRAARFNFAKFLGLVPTTECFHRCVARVKPLGWHVKIFGEFDEYKDHIPFLRDSGVTVVIDHMGRVDFRHGLDQPAMRTLLDLLRDERWWIMLSGEERHSASDYPWDDSIPFARAFAAAAPDRTIWATDWPHVRFRRAMPNDADLLEMLYRYVPDAAARRKILVDNPARLYGFETP
jgi:predicted TIM-barrel fold metal-dependent hydrolase